MIVRLEYLYHYRCVECKQWWSIADIEPGIGETVTCPACRHSNTVNGIMDSPKSRPFVTPQTSQGLQSVPTEP